MNINEFKAIETKYSGYRFRSRLEARWAVFFDACGVKWEYEPEGYNLGKGVYYLPDFLLHGVTFNHANISENNDLFVEVKGKMTEKDAEKIERFSRPILVVSEIPDGEIAHDICMDVFDKSYDDESGFGIYAFNFWTVDGDYFSCVPGVGKDGRFHLFGSDSNYLTDMDDRATEQAYYLARTARFEHGERPGT